MKTIKFILFSLFTIVYSSFAPNLFGSRKRRKAQEAIADEMAGYAEDTQREIDEAKSINPMDSAGAKSAMATASRNAKQQQQRYANMMGGGASSEAMVAAQGQTQQAIGSAAGQIAAGAENTKASQISNLQGIMSSQQGQAAQYSSNAANEIGSGWSSFFDGLSSVGSLASGVGQAAGALSDMRMKENIEYIGMLQGEKIYKFNYKGDPSVIIGVMAQNIEKTHPENVVHVGDIGDVEDVLKVRYDKIFKTVKE